MLLTKPLHRVGRAVRATALGLGAILMACDAGSDRIVATAGDHELSVDQLVDLLARQNTVASQPQVVDALANFWVDYTLLAIAAQEDSLFTDLDLSPLLEPQFQQEIIDRLPRIGRSAGHRPLGRRAQGAVGRGSARGFRSGTAHPADLSGPSHPGSGRQRRKPCDRVQEPDHGGGVLRGAGTPILRGSRQWAARRRSRLLRARRHGTAFRGGDVRPRGGGRE